MNMCDKHGNSHTAAASLPRRDFISHAPEGADGDGRGRVGEGFGKRGILSKEFKMTRLFSVLPGSFVRQMGLSLEPGFSLANCRLAWRLKNSRGI